MYSREQEGSQLTAFITSPIISKGLKPTAVSSSHDIGCRSFDSWTSPTRSGKPWQLTLRLCREACTKNATKPLTDDAADKGLCVLQRGEDFVVAARNTVAVTFAALIARIRTSHAKSLG